MQGTNASNKIWMNEWCLTQNKERELRDIGSNTNTRICFEVRAPCSTSPPTPPCRISNPLSVHRGYPPREPSPRRICYNTRSTELLSQTTTSQPRGIPTTNTSTEEVYKLQLHLSLEGANNKPQPLPKREQTKPQPLPKREHPTKKKGFTTKRLNQLQTLLSFFSLFPTNKWS